MTHLVFLDTETTGLGDRCDIWEIGLIVRRDNGADVEAAWQLCPDLSTAEPTGLRIGRYYERMDATVAHYGPGWGKTVWPLKDGDGKPWTIEEARGFAYDLAGALDGATIVGAVPDFDARHLTRWLRKNGQCGTWHYHLVDVETLAAGRLQIPPPWNFDRLLAAYGLEYDEADRHTALGDARMVRDLYDAVMGTEPTPPLQPDTATPTA